MSSDGSCPAWLVEIPFAHRGLHGEGVPENSRSAFVAAARAGYGAELDVRLSADGTPVVFHDAHVRRMTGQDLRVADLTSQDLARLRLLDTDDGIPELAEALALLHEVPVMVELKTARMRPGPLEAAVAGLLREHRGPACVASFNPVPLRWLRRHHPDVVRVLTATAVRAPGPRDLLARRMAQLRAAPSIAPAAVSYGLDGLPHPAVDRWRGSGGAVLTWTVRDAAALDRARQLADNVIFEHVRP